jgi:N-acetylmuramoyl-L-alanine amidase
MLAGLIQNNLVNNLKRKNRGVKQDVWWVLHNTYMPSVLVELGFLTHKREGPYINSNKGRKEMAGEITKGIVSYRDNIILATSDAIDPVITKEEIKDVIEEVEEKIYPGVVFRVQLAAGKRKLDPTPENFKGLNEVVRLPEDGLYKYYYGQTSDYNKIQVMKAYTRERGFTSSYVVAFRNGVKIPLSEALNSAEE